MRVSSFTVHDLPKAERPRERLKQFGPEALSAKELLALIIGCYIPQKRSTSREFTIDGLFYYIQSENKKGKNLFGGIVTNTDTRKYTGRWVYIDTHGQARGTLTEYKLRLTGSAGKPPLRSGTHSPTGKHRGTLRPIRKNRCFNLE